MRKLLSIVNEMKLLTFTDRKTLVKVNGQDQKLQLAKVKTGIAGLSCYMANKITIVVVLKKTI